jgi:hypothetical protein
MKPLARWLAAAVSALLFAGDVAAATPGVTPDGWRYILGGTAAQDEAVLHVHANQYSLLVMTAGRRGQAMLTGVRVRILDGGQAAPFDRVLPGTWLLVDVPAGRYEIDATCRSQQQRQPVVMSAGDHQAMVFYFEDTGEDPAD